MSSKFCSTIVPDCRTQSAQSPHAVQKAKRHNRITAIHADVIARSVYIHRSDRSVRLHQHVTGASVKRLANVLNSLSLHYGWWFFVDQYGWTGHQGVTE